MNIELIASYKYHRALANRKRVDVATFNRRLLPSPIAGLHALACLLAAREDFKAGKKRYGIDIASASTPFKVGSSQCRYFSDYRACGFRLLGLSPYVAPLAVEHNGWYTRVDDYDEMLTGAVFLLPGRDGHARVYAGYIEQGFGEDGAATIDIVCEERVNCRGGELDNSEVRDVACAADRLAEIAAEFMREHDAAGTAGLRYAANCEDVRAWRDEARNAARAYRETVSPAPGLREIVERDIRRTRDRIAEALAENEMLKSGDNPEYYFNASDKDLMTSFNDGAGSLLNATQSEKVKP